MTRRTIRAAVASLGAASLLVASLGGTFAQSPSAAPVGTPYPDPVVAPEMPAPEIWSSSCAALGGVTVIAVVGAQGEGETVGAVAVGAVWSSVTLAVASSDGFPAAS